LRCTRLLSSSQYEKNADDIWREGEGEGAAKAQSQSATKIRRPAAPNVVEREERKMEEEFNGGA
jgi:hypothetical protein